MHLQCFSIVLNNLAIKGQERCYPEIGVINEGTGMKRILRTYCDAVGVNLVADSVDSLVLEMAKDFKKSLSDTTFEYYVFVLRRQKNDLVETADSFPVYQRSFKFDVTDLPK